MKSFWQINRNWFDMLAKFEENGGEETDEMAELLAINKNDLDDKVAEQLAVLGTLEDENERFKVAADKLDLKMKSNKSMIDKIKKNIAVALDLYSDGKMESEGYKLSVKRTKAVNVFDVSLVPRQFVKYKLDMKVNDELRKELLRLLARFDPKFVPEVDKVKLKEAFDNEQVSETGFTIDENKSLVRR